MIQNGVHYHLAKMVKKLPCTSNEWTVEIECLKYINFSAARENVLILCRNFELHKTVWINWHLPTDTYTSDFQNNSKACNK